MGELKGPVKILGVDFGDARTGLAVSDPTGLLASGAGCITSANLRRTAEAVSEEARTRGVTKIIIGNPVNMNGTEGPRSERVKAFAAHVAELSGIPVELLDERLSTANAHQILNLTDIRGKKRKTVIDEMSARLILQNYLDKRRAQTANQYIKDEESE